MKDTYIRFRCSERDKAELQRQAEEYQMSMSEYLIYLIRRNEKKGSIVMKIVKESDYKNVKRFSVNETMYGIITGTVIASCDEQIEENRQNVIIVREDTEIEKNYYIVFGYEIPETEEDFKCILSDKNAWETEYDESWNTLKSDELESLKDIVSLF